MMILKCHFLPFSNRSEDLFPSVIPLTVLYVTTKWQNWFAKRVLGSFLINRVYIFPFKCVTQHIFSPFELLEALLNVNVNPSTSLFVLTLMSPIWYFV